MRGAKKFVAEVCLYGTTAIGAGWLALIAGQSKPFGEHAPRIDRCFTEAVWAAMAELEARGVKGWVRIFAPGGERFADVETRYVPAFGDLPFKAVGS